MEYLTADEGQEFIYPTLLVPLEEVIRSIDEGKQIVYYVGESLGIAKTKSRRVCDLSGQVWKFAVESKRGHLVLRKIEGRNDGLNRYEYSVIPRKCGVDINSRLPESQYRHNLNATSARVLQK